MSWLTRLVAEEAGHDRDHRAVWEMYRPLVFRSERYGDLLIPVGFRTNYVSCPRWPFIFAIAGDKAHKPSALHDLAYTLHAVLVVQWDVVTATHTPPVLRPINRREADDLFLEALDGEPLVGETLARIMYRGVRLFGQSSWEDDTNILQPKEIRALSPA